MATLLFLTGFDADSQVPAQTRKTIIRRLTLVKEPVELFFKLRGEPVKVSEVVRVEEGIRALEFDADSDWLKDLSLELRNTSGKAITYVVVNLHFPGVTKNGSTALHQIFLGVDPDGKFPRAELRLAPTESIVIPLRSRYEEIQKLAKLMGVQPDEISTLWLEMHSALFEDGTLFEAGVLYRRSPDDPQRWVPIDK